MNAKTLLMLLASFAFIQIANSGQLNLILNSDINSLSNWTTVKAGGTDVSQYLSTTQKVSGNYSLRSIMYNDGSADWRPVNYFNVDDRIHYRLRGHVYATNVSQGSHAVEVQWFDSSHTYLGRHSLSSDAVNAWVEVMNIDITPPSGATQAYVLLRTYKIGTYYFDDIVFQRKDIDVIDLGDNKFPMTLYNIPESQLLFNPNMEEYVYSSGFPSKGSGHTPPGWDFLIPTNTPAVTTWDKDNVYAGLRSLKTEMLDEGTVDWRQWVKVESGEDYILSAAIYASNTSTGSHSVEVQWFTDSAYISRNTIASTTQNIWSICQSASLTAPATATRAAILCRTYKPGTYYFDKVEFSQDRTLTDRYAEAYNAGFNNLRFYEGNPNSFAALPSGMYVSNDFARDQMYQTSSSDPDNLIELVDFVNNCSNLAVWHAPDEPAWRNLTDEGIVNGCDIVKANSDPWRPIWINHAPAALPGNEEDFSLLKPYNLSADIVSIDVYPVPNGTINSRLESSNNYIDCVGEYVDVLYNDVVSDNGYQQKPIWMVLQGFSRGPAVCVELHWFDASANYISRTAYEPAASGSWQQISDTNIEPPANADYVWVLMRTYGTGTYNFDDVNLSVNGSNLLENSDMETGSPASWATWLFSGIDPNNVIQSWDAVSYYSSNHSLKTVMLGSGSADWRQRVDNINPASTYSLSARVKVSNIGLPIPTWTETRFMAYNAIIHGARGLAYYGIMNETNVFTTWPGAQAGLWDSLKRLASEINGDGGISDILMTGDISFRTVTATNSNIETLLMEYDGNMYLFAANKSESNIGNVSFTISGLPVSSVTEYFNENTLSSSNSFTDGFDGYEVHVYEITD